jgi:Txe/YoeB family toxin of Txe-Axe toxin-antitoxin module
MADNSTPSAPASTSAAPSTATLGTSAAGQAQSAQIHKNTPNAPNNPATAPKQAAQAQAVINDPNAPKAAKVEAKKMLKSLSYKLDGQDFTENLPFEIPDDPKAIEYMRRELQMSKMGQKRAQYASGLEKDIQNLVKDIKANPFKVLQDPALGVDVKDAIKKYIEQEIENSQKSPEQLALEAAQQELKALKDQQEFEKKSAAEQEQQRMAQKFEQEYDEQITNALNSRKIPRSPAAVKKILDYAQLAVNANKDVSINDIIPFVAEELRNDYLEHVNALPDESLEEFFGKTVVDRLRKTAVKRVKTAASQNPALKAPTKAPSTGKAAEPVKAEEKKQTYKQFFKSW